MKKSLLLAALMAALFGCAHIDKKEALTPDQQRAEIRSESSAILTKVLKGKPELQKKIKSAPGYATFSALNVNLLVLASTRGTGVVVDRKSGDETFMQVTSLGTGIGAGIKDLRALLIFNDQETLRRFIDSGWQFGAQADASAKSGDQGLAIGESASVAPTEDGGLDTALSSGTSEVAQIKGGIEVYRITETGISLQATVAGTKFSKLDELNK